MRENTLNLKDFIPRKKRSVSLRCTPACSLCLFYNKLDKNVYA